jgi:hypothetical protein
MFVNLLSITYALNADAPRIVVHFIKDTIVTIAFTIHASSQMFDTGRSRFVLQRDDRPVYALKNLPVVFESLQIATGCW